MNSRRLHTPPKTHLVQRLKSSTLRCGGERGNVLGPMSALGSKADMDQTYSIISSARPSNGKENARPCTFAVFRLITNSTLVCCSTGNSAAFAPLDFPAVNSNQPTASNKLGHSSSVRQQLHIRAMDKW